MAEQLLPITSPQILGPYHPLGKPSKGGDLTRVDGRPVLMLPVQHSPACSAPLFFSPVKPISTRHHLCRR